MAGKRILIVDDDSNFVHLLQKLLLREGFEISTAANGADALKDLVRHPPDLVLLDIALPAELGEAPLDGIDVLRRLREDYDMPVIMLSLMAVGAVKVMALNLGADDYITKPYDPAELLARINAVLRRVGRATPTIRARSYADLRIDPESRRVWKGDHEVPLTAIEFELLWILASRPNRVFSRDQLIELAWKHTYFGAPKVVDVHIGHIRKKIEADPAHPKYIVTMRGVGYRFGVG